MAYSSAPRRKVRYSPDEGCAAGVAEGAGPEAAEGAVTAFIKEGEIKKRRYSGYTQAFARVPMRSRKGGTVAAQQQGGIDAKREVAAPFNAQAKGSASSPHNSGE